jgi:S1-C subfamily serine protease
MKQAARIPWITGALGLLVVVLAMQLYWPGTAVDSYAMASAANETVQPASPIEQLAATSSVFTELYEAVSPSVVAISVSTTARGRIIGGGTGSGLVLDAGGHLLTNAHVVDGATEIEVEFYDGTLAWAHVVGTDADSDLAVLKVDVGASTLHPGSFRDSGTLTIGEIVLAIGSPFGQDWTLTTGIISGLNRTLQGQTQFSIGGVIQTDAAINPGNSGGPLLDLQGQVIGVNSQIATTTSSNSGVGFAVPSTLAQRVAQDLIERGLVEYSYLGISGTDITLSLIDSLGLPHATRGIYVSEVSGNGPAGRAGLRSAAGMVGVSGQAAPTSLDIITAIDGYAIKGMDDLVSYLANVTAPGQVVRLTVLRDGQEWVDVDVQLDKRPAQYG